MFSMVGQVYYEFKFELRLKQVHDQIRYNLSYTFGNRNKNFKN